MVGGGGIRESVCSVDLGKVSDDFRNEEETRYPAQSGNEGIVGKENRESKTTCQSNVAPPFKKSQPLTRSGDFRSVSERLELSH